MNKFNLIIRVLILALLLCFSACSSKENSTKDVGIKTITIEIDGEDQRTFSQLVDSMSFIALETKEASLIGRITKLRFKDSRIYILDKRKSNCLFVFDSTGRYLFKIDEAGKGPGEYVEASGFCITENQDIVLNDFSGKKILFYNSMGEFVRELHTDFSPEDIASLGDGLLAITSFYPSKRLIIMGSDGKVIRREFDREPGLGYVYTNDLVTGLGRAYFRENFEDTIFQIDGDKITKKYLVDFQEKKMLKSYYMSIPYSNRNGISARFIPYGFRFGSHNLVETHDYLSFYFWETPRRFNKYWCLYNKKSGQTTYMNVNRDYFDDLFGDRDPPQIAATKGKQFCFAMDSYKLLGRLDKTLKNFAENKPEALEQVKLISEGLSNNSNPILVVLSVKVNFVSDKL